MKQITKNNGAGLGFKRTTIATSRLMDFCSEKELVAQTGHQKAAWPLVILKELMDNALDACEDESIAPVIGIEVSKSGIEVHDNGVGIPIRTVQRILDFTVRVSSREAYVAPDRGAQGNALKTLVMMPFVLSGNKRGKIEITSRGVKHIIDVKVDTIRQEPAIEHKKVKSPEFVRNGSSVRLYIPWCVVKDAKERFLQIADDYAFLNPHLELNMDWMGEKTRTEAIDKDWVKWRPNEPTSAHWYELEHFTRLIGAYIAHDQDRGKDRTVREVVAEFRGLSSTAKQKLVLESTGLARVNLSALVKNKTVNGEKVGSLLAAMKMHTKHVKPNTLGVIGKDNLAKKFEISGCDMKSFDYCKIANESDEGLPFVIETAFGWFGEDSSTKRRIVTGVNWSPGIINPFRELGAFGQSLDSILEQQRIGDREPVVFLLHCAYPRVEYTDRGKSAVVIQGKEDERSADDDDDYEPEKEVKEPRVPVVEHSDKVEQIKFDPKMLLDEKMSPAAKMFFSGNSMLKAVTSGDSCEVDKMLDSCFGNMMSDFLGMKK